MNELKMLPLEKIHKAFADHKTIKIRKNNGQVLEPGYVMIMYGDIAFRIQPKQVRHESHFIRMDEVRDVVVEEAGN